jgi:hypothetical protein
MQQLKNDFDFYQNEIELYNLRKFLDEISTELCKSHRNKAQKRASPKRKRREKGEKTKKNNTFKLVDLPFHF